MKPSSRKRGNVRFVAVPVFTYDGRREDNSNGFRGCRLL